eukprot:CAMPEP_0172652128 /NCGR_PEP_ID=MMETSP1068-20121228/243160_1 /TAXON_ID=35684 /ORGANISM="Pseudopedinella elastica, Strain CCMP716" /LENGTH=309 /DNA_ID=CAMNT_0013466533 /DNA_START=202 /DNA_END=1133 /DNA_ORIENTATION=+
MSPLMQDMLDQTSRLSGWDNFGWSRAGDRLNWRSAFEDIDSMMAMVDRTDNLMSSMLAGPSVLDRLDFVGPSNRMNRLVADMNRRFEHLTSPDYFETLEEKDVQTGFFRKDLPSPEGALSRPNSLCTMTPHYEISDWNAAKPIMQASVSFILSRYLLPLPSLLSGYSFTLLYLVGIIDTAYSEPGCTYFGWTKSGNKLQSRESFTDGEAMKNHLESVKPLMQALKSGPAKLERLEMSGPGPELEKIKAEAQSLNPEYFALEGGTPKQKIEEGPYWVDQSGNKLQTQELFTDGEAMKNHIERLEPLMQAL